MYISISAAATNKVIVINIITVTTTTIRNFNFCLVQFAKYQIKLLRKCEINDHMACPEHEILLNTFAAVVASNEPSSSMKCWEALERAP
jgi:hypothetical protein